MCAWRIVFWFLFETSDIGSTINWKLFLYYHLNNWNTNLWPLYFIFHQWNFLVPFTRGCQLSGYYRSQALSIDSKWRKKIVYVCDSWSVHCSDTMSMSEESPTNARDTNKTKNPCGKLQMKLNISVEWNLSACKSWW